MVADTSREAYGAIQHELGYRQQQVLEAIEELGEASNYQVAVHLKLDINQVTGRVNELSRKSLIELAGSQQGRYNKRENVWKVSQKKDEPEQLSLDCE